MYSLTSNEFGLGMKPTNETFETMPGLNGILRRSACTRRLGKVEVLSTLVRRSLCPCDDERRGGNN